MAENDVSGLKKNLNWNLMVTNIEKLLQLHPHDPYTGYL
jgi:hypothetical protein